MTSISPVSSASHAKHAHDSDAGIGGGTGGDGSITAGTYNLGGGNERAKTRIDETARLLAQQVAGKGVDVVALQEVDVGTADARTHLPDGFDDHNEYVLAEIAAEEAGLQGDVSWTREETVDDDGSAVVTITGVDADGRTARATISREAYVQEQAADGSTRLVPATADDADAVVHVYSAQVQSPDGLKSYDIVYGSSIAHDGGTYGNAVLLGPEATLARDGNGVPDVARHDLGANDPNGENRTALEVNFQAAGEQATVFSAHLTAGGNDDDAAVQARLAQYDTLASLAEASGDNTLLLGDFNTQGVETVGPLTGENDDENDAGGWWIFGDGPSIDRIYVSDDVTAGDREKVGKGGSDHEMLTWRVDLDA